MAFEQRGKADKENREPTEGRSFGNILHGGFELISSRTGSRTKKIEKGALSALSAASADALEAKGRGDKVASRDFFRSIIAHLPPEHFPGIKVLQESDPRTMEELTDELLVTVAIEDKGEREAKISEVIERYEIVGAAGEEVRQLLNLASGLDSAGEGEIPAQELERFQNVVREASASRGGAKEKFWSGGGLILKFIFLVNALIIFGLYKLSKLAREKGLGLKTKK